MKTKMAYVGAGAGLLVYAIYGLMPGTFIGGVLGLNIAGAIFGYPVAGGAIARIIVAVSMLAGIMISGLAVVTGSAAAGWILGKAAEVITHADAKAAPAAK